LKEESKLWQKVKKNTPGITWTRVESWASFGFPDLVGYTVKHGFFTVELKVTKSNRVAMSPHQIAFHVTHPTKTFILVQPHGQRSVILVPGTMVRELADSGLSACTLAPVPFSSLETQLLARL